MIDHPLCGFHLPGTEPIQFDLNSLGTEPILFDLNSPVACATPPPRESQHFVMAENGACVVEVNGDKSNAIEDHNIVDTLIPDLEHTDDEHVENSQHDMWKGRQFPDRDSFRETLAKFAMHKNFAIKPLQTSKTEVTARCADHTCPWRIHASIVASGPQSQVRTDNNSHCCSKPMMGMGHRQATSILVAKWIKERLRHHPSYTPKEIITDFQLEFGVLLSYRKAWKAKEIAMLDIRGSFVESFSILPHYCLKLQRTNPGSVTIRS